MNFNLYDNVEVKKSTVTNGFGLFAIRNIMKDEMIYKDEFLRFPADVVDKIFSLNSREKNMAMMEKMWGCGNDYCISLNIDQYINHSNNPNCCDGIALKDIKKGDEILENYSYFDNEEWFQEMNKKMNTWCYQ